MSELSAEEKRRVLRERRQAKMAQGKASERLNTILTQGASVHSASAVSGADATSSPAPTSQPANSRSSVTPAASANVAETSSTAAAVPAELHSAQQGVDQLHDDPEVPDISSLLRTNTSQDPATDAQDMDAIMQKIFASAGGGEHPPTTADEATSQFFAEMMKTMSEDPNSIPELPENASYQTKLAAYYEYQQKGWKARFLVARFLVHSINFLYHYRNIPGFSASAYSYIRDTTPSSGVNSFLTVFASAEIVIISSYFLVLSSSGLLELSAKNHPVSKLLSLASTVSPPAASYQSLLNRILVYWGGVSIILGDLMLVVVFFGLTSLVY